MVEMLDIYDENLRHLGVKDRDAVHRDGDWHRVFHCWVIYRDPVEGDVLVVQRRGALKKTFPNYLDVTAAGHFTAGETMRDGVREVQEELGIKVHFEDLIPLGRRLDVARYGELIDREFTDCFLCIYRQPISAYQVQRSEVAGLVAVPIDAAIDLCEGRRASLTCQAAGLESPTLKVTLDDFVPRVDAYLYKVLLLAKRCLNGERSLAV
ncbi:MAG TPA: NUDIX domain-containing protein [Aggregatilineales bacterium]|nr:NUDIX domain-containing protein [Aggregatilineales bacterium]